MQLMLDGEKLPFLTWHGTQAGPNTMVDTVIAKCVQNR